MLASCAGDGEVRLHDVAAARAAVFSHHSSRVKKMVTEPGNPHLLITCSEDGTGVLVWSSLAEAARMSWCTDFKQPISLCR